MRNLLGRELAAVHERIHQRTRSTVADVVGQGRQTRTEQGVARDDGPEGMRGVAAIGAHVAMHVAAVLHGAETVVQLPPHY